MKPLAAGDPPKIGKFELLGRLGSGGMGRVYLGRSPARRLVAIKVIHEHLLEHEQYRARFEREIIAAQKVNGFYTASVVDADASAERPWLATAFIDAPTVLHVVQTCGPLPDSAVRWLAAGIAEALQAIHSAGLVHRDLTPNNVLLDAGGPRVIDFGIARPTDGSSITPSGHVIGTPAYMAPEQTRADRGQIGPATDVFSLGSIIVYAATGYPSYEGDSIAEVLWNIAYGQPDLRRIVNSLRDIVSPCFEQQPSSRPSLSELIDQLTIGLDNEAGFMLPAPVRRLLLEHDLVSMTSYRRTLELTIPPVSELEIRRDRPAYHAIATIAIQDSAHFVTISEDGRYAYVTGSHFLSVINTAKREVIATIPAGGTPYGVAVSPDGRRVYVAIYSGSVNVFNVADNAFTTTIAIDPLFPHGVAVTPDGSTVYVTSANSDRVSVIDTARDRVSATIKVGNYSYGVAISPDGRYVHVAVSGEDSVAMIDSGGSRVTARRRVTARTSVESKPHAVAISRDGRRVYSANFYAHSVSAIDTATSSVVAHIPVGKSPYGIAVSPDGHLVYATSRSSNSVSVVDTSTNTMIMSIHVGRNPTDLAISPDGRYIYTTNADSKTVSVIEIER